MKMKHWRESVIAMKKLKKELERETKELLKKSEDEKTVRDFRSIGCRGERGCK